MSNQDSNAKQFPPEDENEEAEESSQIPPCTAADLQLIDYLTRLGAKRMAERLAREKEAAGDPEQGST